MDRNSFGYFYGRESDQFSFYRVPKALVTDAEFSRLSLGAKFLYGILLDRMNLSAQNGWFDEKNRVYIIYTVEDINDALRCSKNTSVELLAELERFGLIEKRRRGFGKPNLIYVKNFITESQNLGFKNPKKSTSGIPDIGIQESQKLGPSNTDKNNTEKSNTDSIPFLSANGTDDLPGRTEGKGNEFTARETYRQIIKDNIGYDILLSEDHVSKYILDEILDLIVDVEIGRAHV